MHKKNTRHLAHAAQLAALYVVLSHFQNLLLPGSGSWIIQFRIAETLCVLALFTPAAVPGLTVGCALFNLSSGLALPLDPLVGSAATFLATLLMWRLRKHSFWALWLPALCNGLLVGWELTIYMGGSFWLNGLYVAVGELLVLLVLGGLLQAVLKKRGLQHLFL